MTRHKENVRVRSECDEREAKYVNLLKTKRNLLYL